MRQNRSCSSQPPPYSLVVLKLSVANFHPMHESDCLYNARTVTNRIHKDRVDLLQ